MVRSNEQISPGFASNMKQASVYVLVNSRGHQLAYNPIEGLIFFRKVADGVLLSERLGFPTSERRSPTPSHVFTIDEMRAHYKARLEEGFRPLGPAEIHGISERPLARSVQEPEDFEYGFTDT
jgi:hypothetical protein